MNPLQSGIPSHYHTASVNSPQPLAVASSQAQPQHSPTLSLARLSSNAHLALDQTEAQPDGHHQLLALLARNGIADGTLHLGSTQGADAHYQQQVNIRPQNDVANLTVRARLNAQAQYDIAGIDLHVPSSGRTESIVLSVPLASAHTHAQTPSVSDRLAFRFSREQLTQALIRQNSPQDFSGAPLPSGASVSTQSMVFSHDSSASAPGIPGPSRTQPGHAARSAPYPAPSLSSRSGATSEGQRPKRTGATDEQIQERLRNDDGSLRTRRDVVSALHAAGLGAGNDRIVAQVQAAGGARLGATDEQIQERLHNDDGSLRTKKDVVSALRAAGLGARDHRIGAQLQAAGGARLGATDEQIQERLHNHDGSLRTKKDVVSALHAAGLGAGNDRIGAQLQAAGGARLGATDEQIQERLHNHDGSLRTKKDVFSALHAAGLGAGNDRIVAQLQAARGQR